MADARTSLSRTDMAPFDREGLDRADAYGETTTFQVIAPVLPLRNEPNVTAVQTDQLLFGESFVAFRGGGEFLWGQSARSGYVGWASVGGLSSERNEPTHRVRVLRTLALAEPSVRSPTTAALSLNALVRVSETEGAFSRVQGLGWAPAVHVAPIGLDISDVVDAALLFLGCPYSWGGKDSLGLDCSGLVQQAFWAAGQRCPRDADQQAELGRSVSREQLDRGDLVCWRGHIGMMINSSRMLHANAHHMAAAIEPVNDAILRIERTAGLPTAYRRVQRLQRAKT